MSWINHLPPACWSTFWKSNFKQQLGCRFDIMDNESYFFVFWHMQLYMSWYIRSFFGFTFLNILYFFKYSCTNIFHRHSLYTFYWGMGVGALIDTEREGCESIIHDHDCNLWVTMVVWVDVPYSDWGVFRRRYAVDISSWCRILWPDWLDFHWLLRIDSDWLIGQGRFGHDQVFFGCNHVSRGWKQWGFSRTRPLWPMRGWGLADFLRWWPPSTMWVGPLI